VELNERSRAADLLHSCIGALATMEDDWSFAKAFANIGYAAAASGEHTAISRLEEQVARASQRSTQLTCWPALASALAARKSFEPAQRLLDRVLELVMDSEEDDHDVKSSLGAIADVCVQLSDVRSLQKLTEWALRASKYYQPELLQALLPPLARSGDRGTVDLVLRTFSWNRWAQRSIVLAAGAAALLQLGDSDAALSATREALEAFFKERDGAVTPGVLRHLIPVLVATGFGEGLVQISQMSAEKWPYGREWGPGVRMLLPALAALDLDEIRPRPYELFVKETGYVDQVQIDLAELHAKRGPLDKAIAAADQARSPRARAEAHLRIARALAGSGDFVRAQERLSAAVSRFPAIRGDDLLIAEMATLAARIEASPRVCWMLKQTFLRAMDQDVIDVDIGLYRNAARSAAILDDRPILDRVKAVPSVPRRPEVRAATTAALMLAFAEAGRFEESDRLKDIVHREVDDIGDVTQRSFPLLDLTQALALGGRSEDARKCMILALDCARHAGRQTFVEILSKGARVLLKNASAEAIVTAVIDVGGLWDSSTE
jgi:tetratricopeptide (TPR) repeat protein